MFVCLVGYRAGRVAGVAPKQLVQQGQLLFPLLSYIPREVSSLFFCFSFGYVPSFGLIGIMRLLLTIGT